MTSINFRTHARFTKFQTNKKSNHVLLWITSVGKIRQHTFSKLNLVVKLKLSEGNFASAADGNENIFSHLLLLSLWCTCLTCTWRQGLYIGTCYSRRNEESSARTCIQLLGRCSRTQEELKNEARRKSYIKYDSLMFLIFKFKHREINQLL